MSEYSPSVKFKACKVTTPLEGVSVAALGASVSKTSADFSLTLKSIVHLVLASEISDLNL